MCTFKCTKYLTTVEEGNTELLKDKVTEIKRLLARNHQAQIHANNKNFQLTQKHKDIYLKLDCIRAKMDDFHDIHKIWMQRFYKMQAIKYEMQCRRVPDPTPISFPAIIDLRGEEGADPVR